VQSCLGREGVRPPALGWGEVHKSGSMKAGGGGKVGAEVGECSLVGGDAWVMRAAVTRGGLVRHAGG